MNLLQRLRERFWFIPAVLCVLAAVAAELLISVDEVLADVDLPGWAEVALYRVGESGSRDILGAIATSSLAVAGTTFSITMAVLALTSSTYGPRLVRNFMADRGNQTVLGVYVATFLYSLLVLRAIRVIGSPAEPDATVFVPHLAANVAVLLAVVNVGVLIYFIHHISDSIQVATIARGVRAELQQTVDRLYPADLGRDPQDVTDRATASTDTDDDTLIERVRREGAEIGCERPGYLQSVREEALVTAAREHDVVLALLVRPGQYVIDGSVLARVHPPERLDDTLAAAVRRALRVGDARSPHQDAEFAVQQLTELAVRALSPGTNDPYTAINALDDLSAGLATLAGRRLPSPARFDDDGRLRVHAPRPGVLELLGPVLDAMRWYATASPAVMHATLDLVERVGPRARDPRVREGLVVHLGLLEEAFGNAAHLPHDTVRFTSRVREVSRTLEHA